VETWGSAEPSVRNAGVTYDITKGIRCPSVTCLYSVPPNRFRIRHRQTDRLTHETGRWRTQNGPTVYVTYQRQGVFQVAQQSAIAIPASDSLLAVPLPTDVHKLPLQSSTPESDLCAARTASKIDTPLGWNTTRVYSSDKQDRPLTDRLQSGHQYLLFSHHPPGTCCQAAVTATRWLAALSNTHLHFLQA
jgi:hypothetical protein